MTVDFFDPKEPVPEVGHLLRYVSATAVVSGYFRIIGVHQVRVRVSRGELSRWRLSLERLETRGQDPVTFTVYAYAKGKKKPEQDWLQ